MPTGVAIAGAGPVAMALGRALRQSGVTIECVASRRPDHARSAVEFIGGGAKAAGYSEIASHASHVIVAVSDRAIPVVAEEIARGSRSVRIALHTCGSYGPEPLRPLAAVGVHCGALHPLQTIRDPERADLRGVTYAVCGDSAALEWAEEIASVLSGHVIRISSEARAVYHAAAVMASNYTVAIIDAAQDLMRQAGVREADALRALEPLVRSTIDNVFNLGPADALTGPVIRGDAATVASHTEALRDSGVAELYRAAGVRALDIARRRGLGDAEATQVLAALGRE